jgi:energy-coupling factor transport system substrate-specific component
MGKLIVVVAAAALAVSSPAAFLRSHQAADGGFAEPNGRSSPQLTAWAALGLRAARADTGDALAYLVAHEDELRTPTDLALVALAEAALGRDPQGLLARLPPRPASVNVAIWQLLALRQARRPAPRPLVQLLRSAQARNGGFGWARGVAPDSNDTAAAVMALRAAGVAGTPIRRALDFLRRLQNRDGGFELTRGRGSDAQSTAWAIQAFVAAGRAPPPKALAYLRLLRRADGSYRYSRAYAVTPVWVTAQVLPATLRKPYPLD